MQRGIQWTFQKHLEDLDFADDIALLSHRSIDLEAKTSALDQQGNKIGLRINQGKTKTMQMNVANPSEFKINEEELEDVTSFYLPR